MGVAVFEPTTTRKLSYEDLRQILLDDYKDKGRLVMDGEDPVIAGHRGHLKALDGYFKGMSAVAITVHTLRKFKAERMANGASGPKCNRALADLRKREVSLPPGIIKNRKPLIVPLPVELAAMLKEEIQTDGPVFDLKNFRREWFKACVKIGLGEKTGPEWYQYKGLTPHDFRRSAVRNLTNAGVDQATAMRISGHRTLSVFLRYNIVSTEQLHAAMAKVSKNNKKTTQNAVCGSRKLLISRGSSMVEQPIRNFSIK